MLAGLAARLLAILLALMALLLAALILAGLTMLALIAILTTLILIARHVVPPGSRSSFLVVGTSAPEEKSEGEEVRFRPTKPIVKIGTIFAVGGDKGDFVLLTNGQGGQTSIGSGQAARLFLFPKSCATDDHVEKMRPTRKSDIDVKSNRH